MAVFARSTRGILPGDRFGRLTVVGKVAVEDGWRWECACECGTTVRMLPGRLGHSARSCGCLRAEARARSGVTRRKAAPSMNTARQRVVRVRGRACEQSCSAGYGRTAAGWVYDGLDPHALRGPLGAYSLDPQHYLPLCSPCHRRPAGPTSRDAVRRQIAAERGRASDSACARGCGRKAQGWIYDGSDPSPLSGPYGPYSCDPNRYEPLCLSCTRGPGSASAPKRRRPAKKEAARQASEQEAFPAVPLEEYIAQAPRITFR